MTTSINNLLHLADNALIIGHRCSEWCGHAPVLEQDIALSNIALDYVGQARNLYQHAADLINESAETVDGIQLPATEDSLAYLRDTIDFKNFCLLELPNGDWAQTIGRIFLFSCFQKLLFQQLKSNPNKQLAAIAEKSLKEITYHVRWSSDWVLRLGDGTAESKARMVKALDDLWPYTSEFFIKNTDLQSPWLERVSVTLEEATLQVPTTTQLLLSGEKGEHTEHLGYILADMQYLQRAYPNSEW